MASPTNDSKSNKRSPFPPLYWLVVMFEFFERGSYYGMMSVLSVYLTDVLHFAKQDVGIIKGTIQPLLYFLPIISGALADRFGYRRTLMVAFSLLGGGYLLTSQATEYAMVFLALVVMGLGAGTFKPVISGTIARCTDASNSTLGFGIFYWSINLGAFLFPLILVPYLKKNVGWDWVIIASAIGTGAMLLPTIFVFREPPAPSGEPSGKQTNLLQTVANAFEIIYSPFVLLHHLMRRSGAGVALVVLLLVGLFGAGGWLFFSPQTADRTLTSRLYHKGGTDLLVRVERNLTRPTPYAVRAAEDAQPAELVIHDPENLDTYADAAVQAVHALPGLGWVSRAELDRFVEQARGRVTLAVTYRADLGQDFALEQTGGKRYLLRIQSPATFARQQGTILQRVRDVPDLAGLARYELEELAAGAQERPFLLPFVGLLLLASLIVLRLAARFQAAPRGRRVGMALATLAVLEGIIWGLQLGGYLSLFAAILTGVIAITLLSLYAIDHEEEAKFRDHFKFLAMIFIYSGFWVLYFQMFDSVLWYVQAYVDASGLNQAVNGVLRALGLTGDWWFDVEHVTVINAGTIILLQLIISNIVKNTRAMPTMISGIALGTLGMGILAISSGIWVFILGIVMFSIGEMTAHPKFISYVGQTAPKSRVAMYMGYLFLYGVIGSSIGGPLGATLYVKFVDELNQPRILWLIFTGIGVATIAGLLVYNAVVGRGQEEPAAEPE